MPIARSACERPRVAQPGRRLVREAADACGAAEATFWLLAGGGDALEGLWNAGATPHLLEQARVPVEGSVIGMVAATGRAACVGPETPRHPAVDAMTGTPTTAMAAAPVRLHGEVCGVLSAVNPRAGGLFPRAALDALEWKAHLLGLVLEDGLGS